jgi:hypothetical protein
MNIGRGLTRIGVMTPAYSSTLKMEAACSSEMPITNNHTVSHPRKKKLISFTSIPFKKLEYETN